MEKAIEIFALINFFVIGISHLTQPSAWVDFFKVLRSYGKAGAMANGFLSLWFGSIIVSFHWVWEGTVPIIITCMGIAQIIKSLVAFAAPSLALKSFYRPVAENPRGYQIGGALFLVLAAFLAYQMWVG
jgi:hypothetical protein